VALSAHAVVPDVNKQQQVLESACHLMSHMGIEHCTVQLEQCEMQEHHAHKHP
jgi:Co/Zn/Cd efflux system component